MDYAQFLARKHATADTPGNTITINEFPELDEFNREFEIDSAHHYIYGLYDPTTNELRYVGKSDRPRERFRNQLNEKSNTHRCHWIQSLRSRGLEPIQRIIDAVPAGADWQSIEIAYIRGARNAGCDLVNGTDGGDGVCGLSDEARGRIRQTWLGRKHTQESLEKIGAASRGRTHTDEYKEYMRRIMSERVFTDLHRQRLRESQQKLTEGQVREIRVRLAAGEVQKCIAADFGVDKGTISNIKRGISYKGVGLA